MSDSSLLSHGPCPKCGSSDGRAEYDDGHFWCFVCNYYTPSEEGGESAPRTERKRMDLLDVQPSNLGKRRISARTCETLGYGLGTYGAGTVQVANYHNAQGQLCAQKVRLPNKDFKFLGDTKAATLFGQRKWSKGGGRHLVITEGEVDALSMSEVQDNKWPVVSIKNGASGAKKDIQAQLEWIESFDNVVFMFDGDEPGQEAARECAELLTPGKAKIAVWPEGFKDASDMLQAGKREELLRVFWDAKPFRPDGFVFGDAITEQVVKEIPEGLYFDHTGIQTSTKGFRPGKILLLTGGPGTGKSSVARKWALWFSEEHGLKVGYIGLEESVQRAALGILTHALGKPLHLIQEDADILRAASKKYLEDKFNFYDHWGSQDPDVLVSRLRWMVKGWGADLLIFDHITIAVGATDDERKDIDNLITRLRSLAEETGCRIILVSHLSQASKDSKGWDEGRKISQRDLRGSSSLSGIPDMILGFERDQQAEDPEDRNLLLCRKVKDRDTGETGVAGHYKFDSETHTLTEAVSCPFELGPVDDPATDGPVLTPRRRRSEPRLRADGDFY